MNNILTQLTWNKEQDMKITKIAEFPPMKFNAEESIPSEQQRSRTSWKQKEIDTLLEKSKRLDEVREEIEELRAYLQSSKFHKDTTVNVGDILNRLPVIYPNNI